MPLLILNTCPDCTVYIVRQIADRLLPFHEVIRPDYDAAHLSAFAELFLRCIIDENITSSPTIPKAYEHQFAKREEAAQPQPYTGAEY